MNTADTPHELFMARALQLAERGMYSADPNPRVGCVLVRDERVIGEGWHERRGEGHAEVQALKSLASDVDARGATAYVTLEPCSHTGATPPCCDQLIQAGIVQVVAATRDPNPLVAGSGFARLEQSGIKVVQGVCEVQAKALNPGFFKRMERGLPYVRCKLAASLDGRTAMASGASKWITGPAARADVQRLRARSSAVLTGVGTVLADDPSLTVRADELGMEAVPSTVRQPLRVVLDSRFRVPPSAKVLAARDQALVVGADGDGASALRQAGVNTQVLASDSGAVDLVALLDLLARRECNEILVEAGAILAGAFVSAGLVDELIIYLAPSLMGHGARPLLELHGIDQMADKMQLSIRDVVQIGDDIRIRANPG